MKIQCTTCNREFATSDEEFDHNCERLGRFATIPNGFGGTTTVRTTDPRAPKPAAPAIPFDQQVAAVTDWILNRSPFTGRKFEVGDMTPKLIRFATEWAKQYAGNDFQFMVDMRIEAKRRSLSPGQAKGTLNCFRADVLREKKPADASQGDPTEKEVPNSRYAIENERGEITFYQATTWQGRRYLKRLVGAPGEFVKYPVDPATRAKVWAILKANPAQAAKLFSRKFTICACCAAPLSLLCSRATGFGEKCAENLGVRYVSDEAEARRILKEEGVSLEGLLLEALANDKETM